MRVLIFSLAAILVTCSIADSKVIASPSILDDVLTRATEQILGVTDAAIADNVISPLARIYTLMHEWAYLDQFKLSLQSVLIGTPMSSDMHRVLLTRCNKLHIALIS